MNANRKLATRIMKKSTTKSKGKVRQFLRQREREFEREFKFYPFRLTTAASTVFWVYQGILGSVDEFRVSPNFTLWPV